MERLTNAKKEFLDTVAKTTASVLWAKFKTETKAIVVLNPEEASSKESWNYFLECLDYEYNSWLDGENTEGVIYLSDGSWFERNNYEGASWWELITPPKF